MRIGFLLLRQDLCAKGQATCVVKGCRGRHMQAAWTAKRQRLHHPCKAPCKGRCKAFTARGHIRLKTANFDFKISSIPKDTTMRQMLSYIASAQGEFGFVDRYGRYVRKWYGSSVKILDNNTIDLPTLGRTSEYPRRHCLQGQRQRNSAAGQYHRLGRACAGV